ncbi:MAG: ACT domain-containing protein [Firmicutes bacterium]|nr:ACT domain-containing protein [Bacillota bacterium]
MDSLNKLREDINLIDKELVKLFEKRIEKVIKISKYKNENNLPIFNQNREEEIIKRNIENKEESTKLLIKNFLKYIMDVSKDVQRDKVSQNKEVDVINYKKCKPIVGFQGEKGSFSEQALLNYFGKDISTRNLTEFEDVFTAIKSNEIDYGVIPIENSSTGGISDIYDLLRKYGFQIIAEKCIKVDHNLMAVKGTRIEDIVEVYSHSQAFKQSSDFFKEYPNFKLIPYKNTATSAKFIKESGSKEKAAVASKEAGRVYGLEILKSNINNNKNNYTRFMIVGKDLEVNDNCDKVSIIISTPHRPGALFNILRYFSKHNINMLKIESRPIINKPWEYFFYIDFEGNLNDEKIIKAVDLIKEESSYFKMLGNYKSDSNLN